jgi:NAD(P)-dependent dehydrogenase (short-subunit alcohol dehydrogenase family)
MRTYLVLGSNSAAGKAVVLRLQNLGEQVIRIDASSADINVDFSTAAGRLEAIEKVMELNVLQVDAIISTLKTLANKPVAIANNFFGVTQFIEGLYDELKKSLSPRITILNYYDHDDDTSELLLTAIMKSGEIKSLKLAQQILEDNPGFAYKIYTSSQKALQLWVAEIAHLKHWVLPGILINSVTADNTKTNDEIAELLVWLASPANQTHTGEILSTKALAELRLTK